MKQLLFLLTAFFLLSAFSLEKEPKEIKKFRFDARAVKNYHNMARLKTVNLRSLAMGALSREEKFAVCEYKFSLYFEKAKDNAQKTAFLTSIHNVFIESADQSDDPDKFKKYLEANGKRLYKEAIPIMGELDAFNFFYQVVPLELSEIPKISSVNKENISLLPPECDCILGEPSGCYFIDQNGHMHFGTCYGTVCSPPDGGGACGGFGTTSCTGYGCKLILNEDEAR